MAEHVHTRTASPLIRERPAQRLLAVRELGKTPSAAARGAAATRRLCYVCSEPAVRQTAVCNPLKAKPLLRDECVCSFLFTDRRWLLLASTTIRALYFIPPSSQANLTDMLICLSLHFFVYKQLPISSPKRQKLKFKFVDVDGQNNKQPSRERCFRSTRQTPEGFTNNNRVQHTHTKHLVIMCTWRLTPKQLCFRHLFDRADRHETTATLHHQRTLSANFSTCQHMCNHVIFTRVDRVTHLLHVVDFVRTWIA